MRHEYETPFKLIEYYGDYTGLTEAQNERLLSRLVYSGRVRLEKSPGEPVTAEELRTWVTKRGLPRGYLPWMGINVEDVLRELRRPRPVLARPNKNPPDRNREG
jgi:hypothetical protein